MTRSDWWEESLINTLQISHTLLSTYRILDLDFPVCMVAKMSSYPLIEVKVVILGQSSSGKTSLVNRYTRDVFHGDSMQSTVGASFFLKKFTFNKFVLGMGIWDTAGSERFESMARMYYRDSKAAIVCYDVTCRKSYSRAVKWVNELKETCEGCIIYLCGTKLDLIYGEEKAFRQVDIHDVIEFADSVGAKVFETSSKTGEGVVELFTTIARDISHTKSVLDQVPSIKLHKTSNNRLKSCACSI